MWRKKPECEITAYSPPPAMSRELLSPEGLRVDGRSLCAPVRLEFTAARANELRQIKIKMGAFSKADGSAYYEQGNTRVLCAVYGPHEANSRRVQEHDRAVINCQYSMATFSTGERKNRMRGDRRGIEISLLIKQTLEAAVLTELAAGSQIDIYITILQADGGTRTASINAATLALIDAGIPMRDFVVACAAGAADSTPLMDLNFYEDSSDSPDMPVALLPRTGKITLLQMDSKIPLELFEKVLDCAREGCMKTYELMRAAARERTTKLLQSRGVFTS